MAGEIAREAPLQAPPNRDGQALGGVDGDSEEKIAQRHTSRGKELEAEDRARIIKGGGS